MADPTGGADYSDMSMVERKDDLINELDKIPAEEIAFLSITCVVNDEGKTETNDGTYNGFNARILNDNIAMWDSTNHLLKDIERFNDQLQKNALNVGFADQHGPDIEGLLGAFSKK